MTDPHSLSLFAGPTGKYPDGKAIRPGDRGGVMAAVALTGDGLITIEFGTSLDWLALKPQDARASARSLLHYAELSDRVTGNPVTKGRGENGDQP